MVGEDAEEGGAGAGGPLDAAVGGGPVEEGLTDVVFETAKLFDERGGVDAEGAGGFGEGGVAHRGGEPVQPCPAVAVLAGDPGRADGNAEPVRRAVDGHLGQPEVGTDVGE